MSCEHLPTDVGFGYDAGNIKVTARCNICGANLYYHIPRDEWGVTDDSPVVVEKWQEAVDLCDDLIGRAEELMEPHDDMAASAMDFLESVRADAERRQSVTDAQLEGIAKWRTAIENAEDRACY